MQCPQCAEIIRFKAKVCRFCGYNFTREEIAEMERAEQDRVLRLHAEREKKERERAKTDLASHLQQAESLALSGDLEQAALVLEEALSANPAWAPRIAGFPCQTYLAQSEPISGYALLVHTAGKMGRKALALQYFRRMLELNPECPGDARQAAREAGIEREAKKVAREKGVSWKWWLGEY